ncbi:MAG: sulfite exporter TauE/SafE family protein [Crenarchaeota archaeon]|nr:sulfite exporter TauE/SafE family protein [Thermoproteota archaeon]
MLPLVLKVPLMIIVGLIAGIIGGFLGIGGCVIMLPALILIFGYPVATAIGTTITAVIVTACSGAAAHIRLKNVDYSTVKIIAVTGAVGSAIGSIIFMYVYKEPWLLYLILGGAFLYVSIRMIYEGLRRGKIPEKTGNKVPGSALAKGLIGFFIGIITGIVGLGGGYALVPAFIYILGSPVKIAIGTSLPSFISMAVVSAGFKIAQGLVDIVAAICLGAGTATGAWIGAYLVPRAPVWIIRLVFGFVFLGVALDFILRGLHPFIHQLIVI